MQIKANLCEIPIFHRDLFEKGLKGAQKGRKGDGSICALVLRIG